MQGHIGDPEVALRVNSESVGHVELGLPPGTLRSTDAGELEQCRDLDGSILLMTIREVKIERTVGWKSWKSVIVLLKPLYNSTGRIHS